MSKLTVTKAAELLGVSRVTVYKWISTGILSFEVSDDGSKLIDTSEAVRVLSLNKKKNSRQLNVSTEQQLTERPETALQREISLLRELLQAKDAVIEEQKQRLLLLEDNRQQGTVSLATRQQTPTEGQAELGIRSLVTRHQKPRTLLDRLTKAADAFLK